MKIRKQLGNYLRDKLGITANRQSLQGQIDYLSALLSLNLPEVMHPDEVVLERVQKALIPEFGEIRFFHGIHRNDIMFQHHLYHSARLPAEAFVSYFQVGARAAQQLAALCKKYDLKPNVMLDFGSGYGRVSRFLPLYFANSGIQVSEVKPLALKFQKKEFGFDTVYHSEDAGSFPSKKYDLILALSVFTHLPQLSFEAWFKVLGHSLQPGGLLVFSFNNLDRIASGHNGSFHFTGNSEDSSFTVSDSLSDDSKYGLTFVSKAYLRSLAEQYRLSLLFEESFIPGKQEVGVIRSEVNDSPE